MTVAFVVLEVAQFLALVAVGWVILVTGRHLRDVLGGIGAAAETLAAGPEVPFSTRLLDLEDAVQRLPQRWEEFKNEAKRSEHRARSLVKDVRAELEEHGLEHPGIEGAARELQLVDDRERGGEPVPAVRENVESPQDPIEDWQIAGLRRKFGGQ